MRGGTEGKAPRLLGAILCGGLSRRFGSDKALATAGGVALVARVARALGPQVAGLVACGRPILGLDGLADRPGPGLGPLGGIAAALAAAHARGFDAVLTSPCDAPALPADLAVRLAAAGGAAHVDGLPVVGLWPTAALATIDALLADGGGRSLRRFAAAVGAAAVTLPAPIANLNTVAELAAWEAGGEG